ncbi:MAG: hypothetical protein ACRED8_07485 [Caulobacteraceae bacterium]
MIRLAGSPELYPLALERESVRLLRLSEADYTAASFLDERLIGRVAAAGSVPFAELASAAEGSTGESDFIFHLGHVGSTLLARLLGRSPTIFALREPAILRTLASEEESVGRTRRLAVMLRLYARVWRADQRSLVKTTSLVSDLGGFCLEAASSAKAILMVCGPQTFIAGILAGEATMAELVPSTPRRLARLSKRLGSAPAPPTGPGEMAAAAWTGEIASLAAIARAHPSRVLWLDFDRFLADPRSALIRVLAHLGRRDDPARLIGEGDLERYSKAPEHAFDAADRAAILARAMVDQRSEIDRGIAWINRTASQFPMLQEAFAVAGRGSRRESPGMSAEPYR